jgi:hypothetical protein
MTKRETQLYEIMTQLYKDYSGHEISNAVKLVRHDLTQVELMRQLEHNVIEAIRKLKEAQCLV